MFLCLIFCVFMFHFCFMFKFSVFMFHSCSYDHTMHYCSDSQPYHLHVPIVLKSGSLNLLEPLGPVQNCNGIALPLHYTLYYNRESRENSVPPTANLTSSRWLLGNANEALSTETGRYNPNISKGENATCRVQLKCDGTRWRTGVGSEGETGEWSGYPVLFTVPRNMVYPALLHGDAHNSAASSRLNWRPPPI